MGGDREREREAQNTVPKRLPFPAPLRPTRLFLLWSRRFRIWDIFQFLKCPKALGFVCEWTDPNIFRTDDGNLSTFSS